ncbi:MAG TPA: thioredoxin domain-containing protein [Gaiellaceae bacterium]|nr:thioredoxin domain-containing protein [Gaiellaceae bacterium]HXV96136.1 thioredoxin domain-containing protein [Gaiellaceae bacterium]
MARTKRATTRVPGAYRTNGRKAPPPPRPARASRPRILIVAGIAVAIALGLVAASLLTARGGGDDPPAPSAGAEVFGADVVESLLGGIPQDGAALGEPDAPVTLVEYADLQCPFCAEWASRAFPELVEDYVRAGDLRIEFRGMAFIGEDSETALRAALAAGEQDRLWNVLDLLYLNQGAENSGWVTDELLAAIGRSVPGLDGEAMLAAMDTSAVSDKLAADGAAAEAAGVTGTPAFELGPTGGELTRLEVASLGAEEFRAAIDELLGR